MKKITCLISVLICFSLAAQNNINIIPRPAETILPKAPAKFTITKNTSIVLEGSNLEKNAAFLNKYLQQHYGLQLPVSSKAGLKNSITLNYEKLDNTIAGAYTINIE